MTFTYVKTFTLMDAWASTIPWDCLVRSTDCCSSTHDHSPMVDDPCAVDSCHEPLREDETCYAVVELGRIGDREQWVCWRHVRPDEGPIRIA